MQKKIRSIIAERVQRGLCPICKVEIAESDKGTTKRVQHPTYGFARVCQHHRVAATKEK